MKSQVPPFYEDTGPQTVSHPVGLESRAAVRVLREGVVTIQKTDSFPLEGRLHDFSTLGLRALFDLAVAPSKIYALEIKSQHGDRSIHVQMQAKCVYCKQNGRDFITGFQFVDLNDASKAAFAELAQR